MSIFPKLLAKSIVALALVGGLYSATAPAFSGFKPTANPLASPHHASTSTKAKLGALDFTPNGTQPGLFLSLIHI